jgi:phage gpG-like protein
MRALASAKPLLDTGRLRNSITGVARTEYGVISASTEYAGVHQFGTSRAGRSRRVKIPARPFFPTEERGLPGNWQREFESILNAAVQRLVANG